MERLREWGSSSVQTPTEETTAATTSVTSRRSASDTNSAKSIAAVAERERLFAGLESGSAVQGPQCAVCDQYCFLIAAVCDACDGSWVGRAAARSSSSSSGTPTGAVSSSASNVPGKLGEAWCPDPTKRRRQSRVRFSCGRHLEELCGCPASEYTFYQRRDAEQLRSAAGSLTSLEEQLEMWREEARSAVAAARATGGNTASSFRSATAKGVVGSSSGSGLEAGMEEVPTDEGDNVKLELPPDSDTPTASLSSTEPPADGTKGKPKPGAAQKGEDQDNNSSGDGYSPGEQREVPLDGDGDEEEEKVLSSLLPDGWQQRPSLRYIGDLIRVGRELKAPEPTLNELRQIVDACKGWVKTIEVILGPSDADSDASAAAAAAIQFGTAKRSASMSSGGSGSAGIGGDSGGGLVRGSRASASGRGGRGAGAREAAARGGGRNETLCKKREQVPFHKAINLLGSEAKLPGRPVETTERLCEAVMEACRLRLQVRSFLGLGEDEVKMHIHVVQIRGLVKSFAFLLLFVVHVLFLLCR